MVILVSFLSVPLWDQESNRNLDVVELFAGVARISRLASWAGLRARAYDITYTPVRHPQKLKRGKFRRSPMDLNGAAGFAFLGRVRIFHYRSTPQKIIFISLKYIKVILNNRLVKHTVIK